VVNDNIRLVEVSISVATKFTPMDPHSSQLNIDTAKILVRRLHRIRKPVTMVQGSVVDIEDKEFVKNGKKDINGEHFSVSLPCIFFSTMGVLFG
jgi:hypothetical protein